MKIYLDFDGTLYNTDKFYQDYLAIMNKYKIDILTIQKEILKDSLFDIDIVLDYIKENLGITIKNQVYDLFKNNYLFSDTIDFLESLKQYDLYLLTKGSKNYQKLKIDSSGISKYFKDIIITNDKTKHDIDYKNSYFVDNNALELDNLFELTNNVIRIRRKSDKYSTVDCKNNILEFDNLIDIKNYLLNVK